MTLFMNTVEQVRQLTPKLSDSKSMMAQMQKAIQYLGCQAFSQVFNPGIIRVQVAINLFRDYDKIFDQYAKDTDFGKVAREAGMEMRRSNTVIAAWPSRLKKRYEEAGVQEEFNLLMESGSNGNERYVEWVLKP